MRLAQAKVLDLFDTRGGAGPLLAQLQMYPMVVWFSAYDWSDPLSASDESNLTGYMNGGGRLFYSAQDYLYVRGQPPTGSGAAFARDYLGVLTYTNDVTVTAVSGVYGNLISDGLGPYTLIYPFTNFSDYVTPSAPQAATTFTGNGIRGSALNTYSATTNSKSVFFAFPFEAIPVGEQATVMRSVVGWLSPLGDAALGAPVVVPPTSTFTMSLSLNSSNPAIAPTARITATLPASVTLLSLGDPSLVFDAATHSLYWSGPVTMPVALVWTVQVNGDAPPGSDWTTNVVIDDGEGITFTRHARTVVARGSLYLPEVLR